MKYLLFCGFVLFTMLETPVPAPSKETQNQKRHAGDEQKVGDGDDPPAKAPSAPGAQSQPNPDAHENGKQGGQDEKNSAQSRWADPLTIVTIAIGCIAVVQVGVYIAQAHSMREQARYLREGLDLTRIAADAAQKSADVAEQTVEHMRLEQRAWLGIIRPTIRPLTVGEKASCTIQIKNTGLTPGTIFGFGFVFCPIPKTDAGFEAALSLLPKSPLTGIRQVIPPDASVTFPVETAVNIDAPTKGAIEAESLCLVVIARFEYVDVMLKARMTHCCFLYDAKSMSLVAHNNYNHME
jgi:hypothetical protein